MKFVLLTKKPYAQNLHESGLEMRIFLLVLVAFILHSCTSEENVPPQITNFYHLNPPHWLYGSWSSGLDSNQIIFHISEHNIVDVQENGSYNIKDSCVINNWKTEESFIFYLQNIFYTYQILEKINHTK